MTRDEQQSHSSSAGPRPYGSAFYPPHPTAFTRFMRTFLPWQIWRFIWINLKMIRIIRRGHGS